MEGTKHLKRKGSAATSSKPKVKATAGGNKRSIFTDCEALRRLAQPHIDSFNFALNEGRFLMLENLPQIEFLANDEKTVVSLRITELHIAKPSITATAGTTTSRSQAEIEKVYPSECRLCGTTYRGALNASVTVSLNRVPLGSVSMQLGAIPIMVRSNACHLDGLNAAEFARHNEDPNELGGYFVVNGNEKIIRMLVLSRRNYPLALVRPKWKTNGSNFTEFGVLVRCVRADESGSNLTLHYLSTGSYLLSFTFAQRRFFLPVVLVLKALVDISDARLFNEMMKSRPDSEHVFKAQIANALLQVQLDGLLTREQILARIGSLFREYVEADGRAGLSDVEIGEFLLTECIAVHLHTNMEKFLFLAMLIRKLFALVRGECAADDPDCPANWEVLLGGHLYLALLRDKLVEWLKLIRSVALKLLGRSAMGSKKRTADSSVKDKKVDFALMEKAIRSSRPRVGEQLENFLATGNVVSSYSISLMQTTGLSTVADRLNMARFIAHVRCVHRGAFFTEMRTTEARRLRPESWGFLCPVNTPDGAPCGLMNHLAYLAQVENRSFDTSRLPALLVRLGMVPVLEAEVTETTRIGWNSVGLNVKPDIDSLNADVKYTNTKFFYPVLLDGAHVGWIADRYAQSFADAVRERKVNGTDGVPPTLEICIAPIALTDEVQQDGTLRQRRLPAPFPCITLCSTRARFIRPVRNVALNKTEWIGILEQVYLRIATDNDELEEAQSEASCNVDGVCEKVTHIEQSSTSMLSAVASLIPFPEMNQSPRNMYQCQMCKQTMGVACLGLDRRADTKMYRLWTPQAPLVRPDGLDRYAMDDCPLTTNAIVAVIANTGYDMEDAVVLNKAAEERGMFDACIYVSHVVDLSDTERHGDRSEDDERLSSECPLVFARDPKLPKSDALNASVDIDGLPIVGARLTAGSPLYSYFDTSTGTYHVEQYKANELAFVDKVVMFDGATRQRPIRKCTITLRLPRRPVIGDKFASRHGQKGVCSQFWPTENMPFSESGIVPDILFNPHGFPSRMTIGMIVEAMAGKSAAVYGRRYDATPFSYNEAIACAAAARHEHPTPNSGNERNKFQSPVEYFGECLVRAGYSYYGTERMYSGTLGREIEAAVFCGVISYQRLRHMVGDKYQVRIGGPRDPLTMQPVKGRKKMGGIRFGEMERDAAIAHGAAFFLRDRLLCCSDRTDAYVCSHCGDMFSCAPERDSFATTQSLDASANDMELTAATAAMGASANEPDDAAEPDAYVCRACGRSETVVLVDIPYVLKYLAAELASCNIQLRMVVDKIA